MLPMENRSWFIAEPFPKCLCGDISLLYIGKVPVLKPPQIPIKNLPANRKDSNPDTYSR